MRDPYQFSDSEKEAIRERIYSIIKKIEGEMTVSEYVEKSQKVGDELYKYLETLGFRDLVYETKQTIENVGVIITNKGIIRIGLKLINEPRKIKVKVLGVSVE